MTAKTASLRDVVGREIRKGHNVGVAERDGNVARMRTGIVEDVHESENKVTIRWTDGWVHGARVSKIALRGEAVDRPRIIVVG